MPEAAEVKIVVHQLNQEYGGQSLHQVEVVGGKFIKTGIEGLDAIKFPLHQTEFHSYGKFIYWSFMEEVIVFAHLGMAANFGERSKHSAIRFKFDTGEVFFNDIRHFGNFKFASKGDLQQKLKTLGWNILEPIPEDIIPRIRKFNHKTISEVLMKQSVFAGCGNYLKNESLYASKIHPLRLIESLSDQELMGLCQNLHSIVNNAYQVGGATIKTFKDMYGNTGKFFDQFKVYSRKTDPLGNPVKRIITPDGRSTFYVEGYQR